jgi:nucleotide-binding universal stress UspA family protein
MNIVVCVDFSTFTEKMMATVAGFVAAVKDAHVSVVHVVDESMYYAATGAEVEIAHQIESENRQLKEMVTLYLGKNIQYIEESGIPRMKISEILNTLNYDLLVIGSHSTHGLGSKLMGGMAEHLMHNSHKPVLFIP